MEGHVTIEPVRKQARIQGTMHLMHEVSSTNPDNSGVHQSTAHQDVEMVTLLKGLHKRLDGFERKLDSIDKRLQEFNARFGGASGAQGQEIGPEHAVAQADKDSIVSCATLEELQGAAPWLGILEEFSDAVKFFCEVCYQPGDQRIGVIELKTSRALASQAMQGRKFSIFKQSIKRHAGSTNHLARFAKAINEQTSADPRNEEAGLICGTIAYSLITKFKTHSAYEEQITMLADLGANVGDINHGRKFVSSLLPHLYETLREQTKSVLNCQVSKSIYASPFTVWADKITPNGTSYHIIGISTSVGGSNVSIEIGVVPLGIKLDGQALAQNIVDTLLKFYSIQQIKKLYMGIAVDGQYIWLKVHEKILKIIYHDEIQLGLISDVSIPRFHHHWWDSAHVIELANADNITNYPWVAEVDRAVKDVNSKYKYGQGRAQLHEEAQRKLMRAVSIGSSSDTRFAAHEFKVLRNFHKNFPAIYSLMTANNDKDLPRINNLSFVIMLSGITDFYKTIGTGSIQVQNSTDYPWQCDKCVELMIENLKSMSSCLESNGYNHDNLNLAYFNECAHELLLKNIFRDSELFRNRVFNHNLRSQANETIHENVLSAIKHEGQKLARLYRGYCTHLEKRLEDMRSQPSLRYGKDSFALESLLSKPQLERVCSFEKYSDLARIWGNIPEVSKDELTAAYIHFSQYVKDFYNDTANESGRFMSEQQLWKQMLESNNYVPSNLDCSKIVFHLLLTALVRNKSECIAESVGSIVKEHLRGRGLLSDESLEQELFLQHNGPPAHKGCHWLVKKALCRRWPRGELHFYRTSNSAQLQSYGTSKVADRSRSVVGRVPPPEDAL